RSSVRRGARPGSRARSRRPGRVRRGGPGSMMGGAPFAGGSRSAANPGGGLPFAGGPSGMQARVGLLLAEEPEHGDPNVHFTYRPGPGEYRNPTLRTLMFRHWHLGLLAILFVVIVSVANQAGPKLVSYAIDDGMIQPDFAVVALAAFLYL